MRDFACSYYHAVAAVAAAAAALETNKKRQLLAYIYNIHRGASLSSFL